MHPAVCRLDRVECVLDFLVNENSTQRQITRGYALGERQDIGLNVPMLQAEPAACPSKAGNNLIRDQQNVVTRAYFAYARPVIVCGINCAASAMDWLADKGSD